MKLDTLSIPISPVPVLAALLAWLNASLALPAGEEKAGGSTGAADSAWVDAMRQVHARFKGKPGTFAHFGDSITVTMAFWTPLENAAKGGTPEFEAALKRVRGYLAKE